MLECLCAVIETWMTSFQPEKCPVKTRGVAVFSGIFPVETASFMFLSQYRDTKAIFYLFYKKPRFFRFFVTSFMSLHSNTKWKWRQLCLCTLRENDARPIGARVGRVLFYTYHIKLKQMTIKFSPSFLLHRWLLGYQVHLHHPERWNQIISQ